MTQTSTPLAPPAHLTLRAHRSAPARVELFYRPASRRFLQTVLWIGCCWGAIPFLLWIPPHYPWVAIAFVGGAFFAYRDWTGRYAVHSFAGICPRCGSPLSLGRDRKINLPHTLTCFNCHFEPRLEVRFTDAATAANVELPEHQTAECVGLWTTRWLADAEFLYCEACHAGVAATQAARRAAEAENRRGDMLTRLSDEGLPLI